MKKKERATRNIETAVAMHHSAAVLEEAFERGSIGTQEEQDPTKTFLVSANILRTFGIENALKALIRRQGGNLGNIHNLHELYEMLDPKTQKRIREKSAAIDIPVNGAVMSIKVEGVIEEHQESFQEWRYRESGKHLPVIPGVLSGTLQAVIQTHEEKHGEDIRREKEQRTQSLSPETRDRALEYYENVLMPKPG